MRRSTEHVQRSVKFDESLNSSLCVSFAQFLGLLKALLISPST